MSDLKAPMIPIFLGEFPVVEVTGLAITINLGRNVHIHIHTADLNHLVKVGDKLPLHTKVPYGKASTPSIE